MFLTMGLLWVDTTPRWGLMGGPPDPKSGSSDAADGDALCGLQRCYNTAREERPLAHRFNVVFRSN